MSKMTTTGADPSGVFDDFGNMLVPWGDHVLTEGSAWFTVNGVSVWIRDTGSGARVELYRAGKEMDSMLDSAQACNAEWDGKDDAAWAQADADYDRIQEEGS